ncbi:MAG: hypothetical protein INH06_27475 [Cupriavidus sp.]|nr:hypothetical protein [Cupriavidus sp.]
MTVLPNAPNADNRPKPASGADLQLRWVGDQADPTSSLRVGEAAAIAQLRHKRLGDKCHDRQPMRAAASRKHSTTTHQNNLEN